MMSCVVPVCGNYSGTHGLISIILQLKNQTYKDIEIIPIICCIENISFVQELLGVPLNEFPHDVFGGNKKDPFYEKCNVGMRMAWGIYVGFFSGDDYYSRHYLEKMLRRMEKDGVHLMYCNFRSHYGQNAETVGSVEQGHITSGSFIVRLDTVKKLGGFPPVGMGDFEFVKKVEESGFKIAKLDEMPYVHR